MTPLFETLRNFPRWAFRGRLKSISMNSYRRLRHYVGLEHSKRYPSQQQHQVQPHSEERRNYDRWMSQA